MLISFLGIKEINTNLSKFIFEIFTILSISERLKKISFELANPSSNRGRKKKQGKIHKEREEEDGSEKEKKKKVEETGEQICNDYERAYLPLLPSHPLSLHRCFPLSLMTLQLCSP